MDVLQDAEKVPSIVLIVDGLKEGGGLPSCGDGGIVVFEVKQILSLRIKIVDA
jgi:hypothetical protein